MAFKLELGVWKELCLCSRECVHVCVHVYKQIKTYIYMYTCGTLSLCLLDVMYGCVYG